MKRTVIYLLLSALPWTGTAQPGAVTHDIDTNAVILPGILINPSPAPKAHGAGMIGMRHGR